MAGAAILDVQKLEILTVEPGTRVRGQCASPVIKIGQMVEEIWRFKRFSKWQNCGSPPSGIFEIHFLTIGAVKRPIVHHRINKFRKGRSNCCGDIKISVIFQDGGRHHHGFFKNSNFNVTMPNFIKIGQTVAEIWRYAVRVFFRNGGRGRVWLQPL